MQRFVDLGQARACSRGVQSVKKRLNTHKGSICTSCVSLDLLGIIIWAQELEIIDILLSQ